MAEQNEPNLGLAFGYDFGETPWNQGMDYNLVTLGAMVGLSVKSKTVSVEPAATDGDVYFVPSGATGANWSGNDNSIAIYSSADTKDINNNPVPIGWRFIPVKTGWTFTVQDESNASVTWGGASFEDTVDLANYVQSDDNVTMTGEVDFSNKVSFSGSYTGDGTELSTRDDVDAKISAYSVIAEGQFVGLENNQSIIGEKTFDADCEFTQPVTGVSAIAGTDFTILDDVNAAVASISLSDLGGFTGITVGNTAGDLEFKTIQSSDASVTITDNGNDIDLTVTLPPTVAAFTDLTDTPADYSGAAGYYVKVNGTEDGLELISEVLTTDFVSLTDTPADYSGQSGSLLAVNGSEDGVEFIVPNFSTVEDFVDLGDVPAIIPSDVRFYLHANAAGDALEFDILAASLIDNDSSVSGTTVADAFNELSSDDIANDSAVTGATITDALNENKTRIDDLETAVVEASIEVEEEGVSIGTFPTMNFIGSGVTAVANAETVDVTIDAGGVSITDHDATGSPAAPTEEGFYRVTGAGDVDDQEVDIDDMFVVYSDETVQKLGKGLVSWDNAGSLGAVPVAQAPQTSDGSEALVGSTWTADFQGLAAGAVVQFTSTDYDWDKTGSLRVSLEQTEVLNAGEIHFLVITTHPANLEADLNEIFAGGLPLSSSTDMLAFLAVGDGGAGHDTICYVVEAGEVNPTQYRAVEDSQNIIGAVHEWYISVNGTDFFMDVENDSTEGTQFLNNALDLTGLGNLTFCVGSSTTTDSAPSAPTVDINYTAGSSAGTAAANAHSAGSFDTIPTLVSPELRIGIYESATNQNINGTDLSAGDIFSVGVDSSTVINLSESGEFAPAPSYILYTPNAEDSLGAHGAITTDDNPYKANSFEEAVTKSKANGRLPIVIDTDILQPAGADVVQPRIKAFNSGSYSYYDLTNIKIYTRDAWINKDTYRIRSMDRLEQRILVDDGVKLRYGDEATALVTDYGDDNALGGGGRQVHGWIGFNFQSTNEVLTNELPDAGLHTKADNFIELHTNTTSLSIDHRNVFLWWVDDADHITDSPSDDEVYTQAFIEVITANVTDFFRADLYIDIRVTEFQSSNNVPIIISDGLFDNSGNMGIHFVFEALGQANTIGSVFNPETEGESNAPIATRAIDLFLTVNENTSGADLDLYFHPVGNSAINVQSVDTDVDAWALIYKREEGRLHLQDVIGTPQTVSINSEGARSDSGVTWALGETATMTVNHTDTIKAYSEISGVFSELEVTNDLDVGGYVKRGAAFNRSALSGTTQGSNSITEAVTIFTAVNFNMATTLPDYSGGTTGIEVIVGNLGAVNDLKVFPAGGQEIDDLGTNNQLVLEDGDVVRFTQVAATKWRTEYLAKATVVSSPDARKVAVLNDAPKVANFNAVAGNLYLVDTSGGGVQGTFDPITSIYGEVIEFKDFGDDWGTNNFTLATQLGCTIDGAASPVVYSTNGEYLRFVYDSTNNNLIKL